MRTYKDGRLIHDDEAGRIHYEESLDHHRRFGDEKNNGLRKMRAKAWLKERGVTQRQVAEVTGFTAEYINMVLSGKKQNFSYKIPQAIATLCRIRENQIDWFEADAYTVQQRKNYQAFNSKYSTTTLEPKTKKTRKFLNYSLRT